jgi:serine phosphatase RsbU (regulator of sigma subunit)
MVDARRTMAGYVARDCAPAEVLAGLNAHLYGTRNGKLATAVVARFSPASGVLTWSRAGHLPILLANRDGVTPLDQPSGPILGVWPDIPYGSSSRRLEPGDLVLMYTDGFVEEPGYGLDEGVRALGRHAQHLLAGPTGDRDRVNRLVRRLRRRNPRDDACALAAQWLPDRVLD